MIVSASYPCIEISQNSLIGHFPVVVVVSVQISLHAKNVLHLHIDFHINQSTFHLKRFAEGLVLK